MESGHYLYVVPTCCWRFKLYRPLDNGWLSECLSAGDLFEYDWIAGRTDWLWPWQKMKEMEDKEIKTWQIKLTECFQCVLLFQFNLTQTKLNVQA